MTHLTQISADLRQLLAQLNTDNPAPADLATLESWFDRSPALYRDLFGLAAMVRRTALATVTPDPVGQAAIRRELEELAESLGYTHAPALEQLLIDNLLACWLRCQWTELKLAACDEAAAAGQPAAHAAYWEQRLSAAQRRYLRAVESLARLRKHQLPQAFSPVQVNIGHHQVNVATQPSA